jgi:hypothetical protein
MIVWLMSFVTTKNVLREMPLLKTEAWVLPAIWSLELLAAESFSKVVCKNHFRTTPLIQFKSTPVSNKAIVSNLKSYEKTRVILIRYFFEDIWVKTFKKSSGMCLMFVSAWCSAWDSMVWSSDSDSVSDWLSILDRRCCRMAEAFCWACFRVCNSDLRVFISYCNSGMVAEVLDLFRLRIFIRS